MMWITMTTIVDGGRWGRSPLSAKLAAYGQSLAIERRLREEKGVGEG